MTLRHQLRNSLGSVFQLQDHILFSRLWIVPSGLVPKVYLFQIFLSFYCWIVFHCVDIPPLFTYSPVNRLLDCFQWSWRYVDRPNELAISQLYILGTIFIRASKDVYKNLCSSIIHYRPKLVIIPRPMDSINRIDNKLQYIT